jgi:chromosome segregation ATPase
MTQTSLSTPNFSPERLNLKGLQAFEAEFAKADDAGTNMVHNQFGFLDNLPANVRNAITLQMEMIGFETGLIQRHGLTSPRGLISEMEKARLKKEREFRRMMEILTQFISKYEFIIEKIENIEEAVDSAIVAIDQQIEALKDVARESHETPEDAFAHIADPKDEIVELQRQKGKLESFRDRKLRKHKESVSALNTAPAQVGETSIKKLENIETNIRQDIQTVVSEAPFVASTYTSVPPVHASFAAAENPVNHEAEFRGDHVTVHPPKKPAKKSGDDGFGDKLEATA